MRPNLNFAGDAADVLAHYQAAFGGELDVMRFAGSPVAEGVRWMVSVALAALVR